MRNGNVVFVIRGRKREEMVVPIKTNNGLWHHIAISCKNHLVTILITTNGRSKYESQKSLKIPKKFFVSNVLFIGGFANNIPKLHKEVIMRKEDFKGCIRRFVVNGITQDLAKQFANLSQCFPRIEKGSYFSGDSYAEYSK